jgi:VWFA-related protein
MTRAASPRIAFWSPCRASVRYSLGLGRLRRTGVVVLALLLVASQRGSAQAPAQGRADQPVFRAQTAIVTVDVAVRDANGEIVRGLTAADFTVLEDGKPQSIQTFAFQEIDTAPPASPAPAGVLAGVADRLNDDLQRAASATPQARAAEPMPAAAFVGRRVLVLLFDVSSMQPEDVQRAVDSAQTYVNESMSPADLVAVVTIGSTISVLSDFTGEREATKAALDRLGYTEGTATPPPAADTAATDEAALTTDAAATDDTGFDAYNNDVRLRALKTLADTLAPIEQKKAILYFSAGMSRSGEDNQIELRGAINAAVRGNVAIYPVDARGLQAVVPGGDARQASGRGVSLFSGQAVSRQFAQLAQSQDTLMTLAADTGGRAFTDTNDFGDAFTRAARDLSAYYLIGYSSTNTDKDGKFRRIQVRVSRRGARVEARAGYYADRDFARTNTRDREAQLDDQLSSAVSSTDLPLLVGTGWFRQTNDRFYVPIALAIPGSAVPVGSGATKVTLDVRGLVRDEQGRTVGRLKDTLDVPTTAGAAAPTLAGRQVIYQSGVSLPPGRFSVKVVVRENTTGTIGSFEAPAVVPQLRDATVKTSSIVMSTQVQPATRNPTNSPLVRDGVQLLPNLTRVATRGQRLYFYYEVYDPALADAAPQVRTSLAFYRGGVKVFETPMVERTTVDEPSRRAVIFQFEVPASGLTPGTYTCQVNIIDTVAGAVAFPRTTLQVIGVP